VHKGGVAGSYTGEGRTNSNAARHKVVIRNHYADQVVEVDVPEDRCGALPRIEWGFCTPEDLVGLRLCSS